MKKLLLIAGILSLGGSVWAKAPLLPLHCYRFTELDENGGIKAVPNSGSGTSHLTLKLYGEEICVNSMRDDNDNPLPGKFGTYSIYENKASSYWLEGDETDGLGCSSATGFAISFWFHPTKWSGDWRDFFGFRMGDVNYNFEYTEKSGAAFAVYDFSAGKQQLRRRHLPGEQLTPVVNTGDWNHFCLVWKPYCAWRSWPNHFGEVWINGQKVGIFVPADVDNGNDNCVLRTLYLGSWQKYGDTEEQQKTSDTGIGEVAVYGSSISDDDVAYLYTHAPGPLPRGREMTVGLHFDRSYPNGGGDSPTAFANSGTMQVPMTMLAGNDGNVNLATEDSGACDSGFGFKVKGWGTGSWLEGDATTGLGASVGTGLTLSYWTYVRDWSPAWSYVLGFGFNESFDFYHDKTDNVNAPEGEGGFAYYGDCELWDGLNQTFNAWHHHVLVLEPGNQAFQYWQDGEKIGTMNFKSELTEGLLRRLCIGPTVKYHGESTQNADAWVGLDELGVYNYAMSEDEIKWLGAHEAALPPLTVTSLARTVSADGKWAGATAEWTLNGTERKIVYPAGEDTQAAVTVTVNGTASLSVDTLVQTPSVVFNGAGTLALSVEQGCSFTPTALTVGSGVTVNLPTGAFAGTVRGSGALSGKLTGTWEIEALDGKTREYLSWPSDADLSEATINISLEAARRPEYPLVENFTGQLPKKILHQGVEDGVFRAVIVNGNLVLKNRKAPGMVVIVK